LRSTAGSKDLATRFAVAYSLAELNDEIAIETKIALSKDSNEDVRDWATFNLHLGLDAERINKQEIKDAFYDRLNDQNEETRYEAIVGLALCKDARVLPVLIEALAEKDVWDLAIEAAREMAHPALLPSLKALRLWWSDSVRPDILDHAIDSCRHRS
jgi:HEAT repeat protein